MSGKRVGILTAGGDSPGLNATIRGFGKAAIGEYGMDLIGFRDGVTGLYPAAFADSQDCEPRRDLGAEIGVSGFDGAVGRRGVRAGTARRQREKQERGAESAVHIVTLNRDDRSSLIDHRSSQIEISKEVILLFYVIGSHERRSGDASDSDASHDDRSDDRTIYVSMQYIRR